MINYPNFSPAQTSTYIISSPGYGGLNLKDLEFVQPNSQSPKMLNMMYRNGAFSKRYGLELFKSYTEEIHTTAYFMGKKVVHAGSHIYVDGVQIASIDDIKGVFINFNRKLYYICNLHYYQFDGEDWSDVIPYVPDIIINRQPDGVTGVDAYGTKNDDLNSLGTAFRVTFHSNGQATEYVLPYQDLSEDVVVEVDGVEVTNYTYDAANGKVTFASAPPEGVNSVTIEANFKSDDERYLPYREKILRNKYYVAYGGNNNSRLLLAGGGDSCYYYSDVFDATYFPETQWQQIGNSEDDITGFGLQYNVCIIFKPREIFSISYYVQNSSNTTDEEEFGFGAFSSMLVNGRMGCDAPETIQLINNQLTWFSSIDGVCTLVSTNIIDERNVRPISRNINRTNDFGVEGLMDLEHSKELISADWDFKYFLVDKYSGVAFVWDYGISPYQNTGKVEADAQRLSWFKFDNFFIDGFQEIDRDMYYFHGRDICKLNYSFTDFGHAINSYYLTPMIQFSISAGWSSARNATEYAKNVDTMYVQCRAGDATQIRMKYVTQKHPRGVEDIEPILIGSHPWKNFKWDTFKWEVLNFAKVFRRKCRLKHIEMAGIMFENDQNDKDMSISNITFLYKNVRLVK